MKSNYMSLPASVSGMPKKTRKINFETCSETDEIELDRTKTLKITQFPINFTFQDLSTVFSCFGEVSSTFIPHGQKAFGRQGFVEYSSEESITLAFKYDPTIANQPAHQGSEKFGISKWLSEYDRLRPSQKQMENMVDKFMEVYDKQIKQETEIEKSKKEAEESEGWIVVGPKKKRKGVKRLRIPDKEPKIMKKQKIEPNLYKKNCKTANAKRLELLKQKFQEDREKVKRLRAQRRFQPGWV